MNLSLVDSVPMECPVCSNIDCSTLRQAYDDRYGQPDLFNLVSCARCKHVMTEPRLRESDLGMLYSTYYPRKQVNADDLKRDAGRSVLPLARLRRWYAGTNNQGQYAVRTGEIMLDIGCGSGLSLLEAQELGAKVYGIEADPNVRRIADELKLNIHIGSLHDEPFQGVSFDLIVLNQVIEHIPDPGKAMEALKKRLKPDGRLVLVFPNRRSLWQRVFGIKWINWHVPYHLHHFDAVGFRSFSNRHGYAVISLKTITPNTWSILQLRVLRKLPKLGMSSPIWEVKPNVIDILVSAKSDLNSTIRHLLRKLLKQTALLGLALFNRFIDLTGLGDSILVELRPEVRR